MLSLDGEQTKVLQTGFCNLLNAVFRFGVLTLFSWGRQFGVDCLCFFLALIIAPGSRRCALICMWAPKGWSLYVYQVIHSA